MAGARRSTYWVASVSARIGNERCVTKPFLESLGASALAVGVIAGGGELFYTAFGVAWFIGSRNGISLR